MDIGATRSRATDSRFDVDVTAGENRARAKERERERKDSCPAEGQDLPWRTNIFRDLIAQQCVHDRAPADQASRSRTKEHSDARRHRVAVPAIFRDRVPGEIIPFCKRRISSLKINSVELNMP